MKLKIVSDGTALGTSVQDENGNVVENVHSIEWTIKGHNDSEAFLTIRGVPAEIVADNKITWSQHE